MDTWVLINEDWYNGRLPYDVAHAVAEQVMDALAVLEGRVSQG